MGGHPWQPGSVLCLVACNREASVYRGSLVTLVNRDSPGFLKGEMCLYVLMTRHVIYCNRNRTECMLLDYSINTIPYHPA